MPAASAVTAVTLYFLHFFSGANSACCVHGTTALLAGENYTNMHMRMSLAPFIHVYKRSNIIVDLQLPFLIVLGSIILYHCQPQVLYRIFMFIQHVHNNLTN